MKQIETTIKILKKVINDPYCDRMTKSVVIGYLGELILKNKLEKEGLSVDHKGKQSKYDLEYEKNDTIFKIDVKTSKLKDEHKWGVKYWGWALSQGNKTKELNCTHFVCLALDEQLDAYEYFVIPAKNAKLFPSARGQFNSVNHGLIVFPKGSKKVTDKKWMESINRSEKLIKKYVLRAKKNSLLSKKII